MINRWTLDRDTTLHVLSFLDTRDAMVHVPRVCRQLREHTENSIINTPVTLDAFSFLGMRPPVLLRLRKLTMYGPYLPALRRSELRHLHLYSVTKYPEEGMILPISLQNLTLTDCVLPDGGSFTAVSLTHLHLVNCEWPGEVKTLNSLSFPSLHTLIVSDSDVVVNFNYLLRSKTLTKIVSRISIDESAVSENTSIRHVRHGHYANTAAPLTTAGLRVLAKNARGLKTFIHMEAAELLEITPLDEFSDTLEVVVLFFGEYRNPQPRIQNFVQIHNTNGLMVLLRRQPPYVANSMFSNDIVEVDTTQLYWSPGALDGIDNLRLTSEIFPCMFHLSRLICIELKDTIVYSSLRLPPNLKMLNMTSCRVPMFHACPSLLHVRFFMCKAVSPLTLHKWCPNVETLWVDGYGLRFNFNALLMLPKLRKLRAWLKEEQDEEDEDEGVQSLSIHDLHLLGSEMSLHRLARCVPNLRTLVHTKVMTADLSTLDLFKHLQTAVLCTMANVVTQLPKTFIVLCHHNDTLVLRRLPEATIAWNEARLSNLQVAQEDLKMLKREERRLKASIHSFKNEVPPLLNNKR